MKPLGRHQCCCARFCPLAASFVPPPGHTIYPEERISPSRVGGGKADLPDRGAGMQTRGSLVDKSCGRALDLETHCSWDIGADG